MCIQQIKILKISKVAPTVVVDYNKHKYLEQQEMLGKIVGKEDKVKAWKKEWEETTAKDGKEIKKQSDKMQQYHCLMNSIKTLHIRRQLGSWWRSVISSIWFKNAT